ncbi:hypothetical protein [Gloeothece verrucosa]|uniref:Uncharacterized protein n=1 Tax=Gloeothece verrucosa (strain PCC 7822) TaxID=497965 RepID=E0U6D8_GLOV7|nr:hypothetical protein [Gloeothece verrucosa]ADN13581.1 hypothetical protein Cyan7822_1590 [Gloeothece verrucosa PCC 7822]
MSDFDNIGKLMYLPVEDIEPANDECYASEFIIQGAVEAVLKEEGRNWLPLIVKEIAEYQYQVVSNPLIYVVAKKLVLERVWCIVIEAKQESIEQVKILNGEMPPKVNLNTASGETIQAALKYLQEQPNSELKALKILIASEKIASSPTRAKWKTFNEIPKLKCGITQGKKLDSLKQVFFLEPVPSEPEIPPPHPPEIISIKRASREEIFERLNYLSTYKIDGFEKINADKIADIIFTESKSKWKSLNPITSLNCGIGKAKIPTLKKVFKL